MRSALQHLRHRNYREFVDTYHQVPDVTINPDVLKEDVLDLIKGSCSLHPHVVIRVKHESITGRYP